VRPAPLQLGNRINRLMPSDKLGSGGVRSTRVNGVIQSIGGLFGS